MTNQQPNGQTTSLTQNSRTRQITLIGLMTAITCILAPLSIPLPFSPVPISLTNLVIFISVFILGMKDATISFLIYLLLGAVGLPVLPPSMRVSVYLQDRQAVSDRLYFSCTDPGLCNEIF